MKTLPAIALTVAAFIGIALHQRSTLATLREEVRALAQTPPAIPSTAPAPARSEADKQAALNEAEAALIAMLDFPPPGPVERGIRLVDALRMLEADEITALIAGVRDRNEIPQDKRDRCFAVCLHAMSSGMNADAIALIEATPDLPQRDEQLMQQFFEWSRRQPADAARWLEEEQRKHSPLLDRFTDKEPNLPYLGILAQTRANPDRSIQALADIPPETDSQTLQKLGVRIADQLADESEHRDYLAALRRAASKFPDNRLLTEVRRSYLSRVTGQLNGWSFDDATALIDGGFTPEEKAAAANRLSQTGDFEEPQKWAEWFAKTGGTVDNRHPLDFYIRAWAATDPLAAGTWLERYPAGAAKDILRRSYVVRIATELPAEAARHAVAMPAGSERDQILRAICSTWTAKDPDAAARFVRENGLEP